MASDMKVYTEFLHVKKMQSSWTLIDDLFFMETKERIWAQLGNE